MKPAPGPQRTMRRAVGTRQFPDGMGALPIIDEERHLPDWVWFVGGGVVTSAALAAGGLALLAYWFNKTFDAVTGRNP